MALWQFTRTASAGGNFQVIVSRPGGRTGVTRDVTYFRGAPTQIDSFSDADPFGDSTAQLTFPSITALDDLHAPALSSWLGFYSNVDIYWVPTIDPAGGGYVGHAPVIDPLTNQRDLIAPAYTYDLPVHRRNRVKVFEGFIASIDINHDSTSQLQVSCQGALFQLDRYLQKPFYPPQPWPLELLIADAFSHKERPHLRTHPLHLTYPGAWGLKIGAYRKLGSTSYTPVGKPGTLWSGYASRQTGSWEHALTGFIQDQLTVMITDDRSHVTRGNQWTLRHFRLGEALPAGKNRLGQPVTSVPSWGRIPVLMVRDRYRAPDFTLRLGVPGVQVRLSGDSTQSENVIYGEGTGLDGTTWRNSVIADNGARTEYLPLAADAQVYPLAHNPSFRTGAFVSEAFTRFGNGFDQDDALRVAQSQLQRDRNPGWTGSVTLSVDPSPSMSRWTIHAGMTLTLLGFAGTGERGERLHISATQKNPTDGTVELTVDSRYRDLLTVDEAQARTRDPLTPVKMLQVNRTSVTVEDIQAPWSYKRSGFAPQQSRHFHDYLPNGQLYPYTYWTRRHPPKDYPHWYVTSHAASPNSKLRWGGPTPILTSEKGTIARSEFAAYDWHGNLLKIPFHVSIYYSNTITASAMPHLHGQYSPYLNDAFEETSPETGQPATANDGNQLAVNAAAGLIIGWGNQSGGVMNRAGFSPGRETDGAKPTGQLVDEYQWTYDNTHNPNYDLNLKPGKKEKSNAVMLYAMFYAEHTENVYFMGRLFRLNPGAS